MPHLDPDWQREFFGEYNQIPPPKCEEDGIEFLDGLEGSRERSLHSGHPEPLRDWPDPRGQPLLPPDKTSLQEACEALKRDCEEIEASRAEKIMSGSLKDIREKLSNGI